MTQVLERPAAAAATTSDKLDRRFLLNDEQVMNFIVRGYHLGRPELPEGFDESIVAALEGLKANPGNGILDAVPRLAEFYATPEVRGALVSLLGEDYAMHGHRHWHCLEPGAPSQTWHQDATNVRHHQVWTVLAMYYPHDVTAEMGPTVIMPGTHFRNAPTDRLATYVNLKGQEFLTVKAGTV